MTANSRESIEIPPQGITTQSGLANYALRVEGPNGQAARDIIVRHSTGDRTSLSQELTNSGLALNVHPDFYEEHLRQINIKRGAQDSWWWKGLKMVGTGVREVAMLPVRGLHALGTLMWNHPIWTAIIAGGTAVFFGPQMLAYIQQLFEKNIAGQPAVDFQKSFMDWLGSFNRPPTATATANPGGGIVLPGSGES